MRAAKVQASLRIRAVSPEPPLLAHTSSESRGTFRQKARSLAPLNGWACAVKTCHDGVLEDTNSLDGAQLDVNVCWCICLDDAVGRLLRYPFERMLHSRRKVTCIYMYNTKFNDLRKKYVLKKMVSLTSKLAWFAGCKSQDHGMHCITLLKWNERAATIATRPFKFIPNIPLLWSYQVIKVLPLQLLLRHSYDVIPFLQWHAMHAMLLRLPSYIPVLILKCQRLEFSQTNNVSQINKFFVVCGNDSKSGGSIIEPTPF